jgi:hypothetical protein
MTEQQRKHMNLLDEAAEKAGGYVSPMVDQNARYDYRKLSEYCKERNMDPQDLTLREMRQFLIP